MAEHNTQSGTFTISRTIQAPITKVYDAFADKSTKERWFKGPDGTSGKHEMDFRVGGLEENEGSFPDGTVHRFLAHYYEILPVERIIYTYEMYLNDKRISVSVAIIEFQDAGSNTTQLTISESGMFLDGLDYPQQRQQGTEQLMQALADAMPDK